jgi:hypothetical protein
MCCSSRGAQEKGKTGWNSVYHQNWWKKLVWVWGPSYYFLLLKFSFLVTRLMAYYAETGRSRPLVITWLLWISLIYLRLYALLKITTHTTLI